MKERLDKVITDRRILKTTERAKAFIIGGSIRVNGETVWKPGALIDVDSNIQIHLQNDGFVSRGGLKLEKALRELKIDVRDAFCLDIGASTGGFTDCLLKYGASFVVAVDVGKNKIAYKLRKDPRVRVVEKFNARHIDKLHLDNPPGVVTIDVSFISIKLVVAPLKGIIDAETDIITLIKPQFELEKPYRGFNGVIREMNIHRSILRGLYDLLTVEGYDVRGYTFSPLRGPKGNIEFFFQLKKMNAGVPSQCDESHRRIDSIIEEAWSFFRNQRRSKE